jgi:hypothetical protein
LVLNGVASFASEGAICKLRSVARVDAVGKTKVVVPNNFTSLIEIPGWTQDSQTFQKNFSAMEVEDESIYTSLAQLASLPLRTIDSIQRNVKTASITSKSRLLALVPKNSVKP